MIKTIKINKSFGENNNFEVIKNNQRNFIMIFGPPGSGKSVAGEHLKEKYNYLLFDSDLDRSDVEKMRKLRDKLISSTLKIKGTYLIGPENRLCNNASIVFKDLSSD